MNIRFFICASVILFMLCSVLYSFAAKAGDEITDNAPAASLEITTIKQKARDIFNQRDFKPLNNPSLPPNIGAGLAPHPVPTDYNARKKQNTQDIDIRNNVGRLFHQTLNQATKPETVKTQVSDTVVPNAKDQAATPLIEGVATSSSITSGQPGDSPAPQSDPDLSQQQSAQPLLQNNNTPAVAQSLATTKNSSGGQARPSATPQPPEKSIKPQWGVSDSYPRAQEPFKPNSANNNKTADSDKNKLGEKFKSHKTVEATEVPPPPQMPDDPAAPLAPRVKVDRMAETVTQEKKSGNFITEVAGAQIITLNVPDSNIVPNIQAPLHLEEAVAFALRNNYQSQASNERTNSAYWDKMGAYSEYLPTINISADQGSERSQPGSVNDSNGDRIKDSSHFRRDRTLTLTQPLIDLSILSDISAAKNRENATDIERYDVREGLAFDTVTVYLNLVQARVSVRLADEYKKYLDEIANRMKQRVEGGGASVSDLERVRGRSSFADSARVESLGDYQTNISEFQRLTRVVPPHLVIPAVFVPPIPPTAQEAIDKALKANPVYLGDLKKIDLASDDRNKSFSGLLPKLSAQYVNSYSYNAYGAAGGNPIDGVYPTQKNQTVMLVAQWNLGAPSMAGGMSAMAKQREQNFRALDTRAKIEQGIMASYTAINAANEREAILEKSIDSNSKVVNSFKEQFANGSRTLFDLLDSYEQLYNSKLNLMRVTIAKAKAAYQVRRLMGELQQSILGSDSL